jgi:dTDP-4-dehydrorhamnose 3,5-epimerase
VRVVASEVYDVVLDVRRQSPTFGKWEVFYLSAELWSYRFPFGKFLPEMDFTRPCSRPSQNECGNVRWPTE